MYCCELCGESTKSGESIRRVVTHVRDKDYPPREYKLPGKSEEGRKVVRDPGGYGHETVKEIAVCGPCEFNITMDLD